MPLKKANPVTVSSEQLAVEVAVAAVHAPKPAYYGEIQNDAKGRQISRQGLFQAALQSPALMQYAPTLEDYILLVIRTANAGLEFVNQ